jgi:hypothetical protein
MQREKPANYKSSIQLPEYANGFPRRTLDVGGQPLLNLELLHSFEVHYPIRFPCFSTIG